MSLPRVFQLASILQHINDLSADHQLFLAGDFPWIARSPAIILPADDDNPSVKDDDDFLAGEGFVYACDLSELQDMVDDALEQLPDASVDDLLDAFNFYYRHQSFIKF